MQATAKELLRTGTHGIRSAALVREAFTYVELGRGKTGPEPGKASDRLMAWMVGQQVAQIKPVHRHAAPARPGGYAHRRIRRRPAALTFARVAIGEHTAFISRRGRFKTGLHADRAREHAPAFQCTVPVSLDETCGATFSIARSLRTIEASRGEVHQGARGRDPRGVAVDQARDLLHGIWDKDLERWMEKYRTALLEGRKRL
jgi:hypothetical protein